MSFCLLTTYNLNKIGQINNKVCIASSLFKIESTITSFIWEQNRSCTKMHKNVYFEKGLPKGGIETGSLLCAWTTLIVVSFGWILCFLSRIMSDICKKRRYSWNILHWSKIKTSSMKFTQWRLLWSACTLQW